jgi:hypothetical protein
MSASCFLNMILQLKPNPRERKKIKIKSWRRKSIRGEAQLAGYYRSKLQREAANPRPGAIEW